MMKVLITGSTGMLGRYVRAQAEAAGYDLILPTRADVDLSNPEGFSSYIKKNKPDAILHLAAETNVDLCERDPARAGLYNYLATEAIASAARECGAWMLYISTSNVFGGEGKINYNELDLPSPTNYYGRSKLWGEKAVERHCPRNSLIVRAGWMIGGGATYDHKFVGKIIKQITEGTQALRAVGDRFGTITRAQALATFILSALKNQRTGTYHFSSMGGTSRFEIAKAIAEFLNFKGSVESVNSSEFPLSAPRPLFESIESIYMPREEALLQPSAWRDDLKAYLAEFNI